MEAGPGVQEEGVISWGASRRGSCRGRAWGLGASRARPAIDLASRDSRVARGAIRARPAFIKDLCSYDALHTAHYFQRAQQPAPETESVSTRSTPSLIVHPDAGADVLHEPVHAGRQAGASERRAPLDAPVALGRRDLIEPELGADLLGGQCAFDVLLVREHQQGRPSKPLLLQQHVELCLAVLQACAICGVDDPNETVGLFKIIAPVRAQRRLPADVPDVELEASVLQRLDVEAKRG